MKWLKSNKWKVIIPILIAAVLTASFWLGGNTPGSRGWLVSDGKDKTSAGITSAAAPDNNEEAKSPDQTLLPEKADDLNGEESKELSSAEYDDPSEKEPTPDEPVPSENPAAAVPAKNTAEPAEPVPEGYDWENGMLIDKDTGKDKYQTDPVPAGSPLPVEPEDAVIGSAAYTCTISISCASILDNMDICDPEKTELVPGDGWILESTAVTFYEGESVFNVLQRTCKQLGIHIEFVNTPIYNSAYIEGIGNLYEFDVGEQSGWMYSVNGWFPNYGCSRYQLKSGDDIRWAYTCDLGNDIGGSNAVGG